MIYFYYEYIKKVYKERSFYNMSNETKKNKAVENEQNRKAVADIVKSLRNAKNISGKTLSLACGLSSNYIIMFENGKLGMPKLSNLIKIAEKLQIPKEELLKIAGYDVNTETDSIDLDSQITNDLTNNKIAPDVINSLINILNCIKESNNFETMFNEKWKSFILDYKFFSDNSSDKKNELEALKQGGEQFIEWLKKENTDLQKHKRMRRYK